MHHHARLRFVIEFGLEVNMKIRILDSGVGMRKKKKADPATIYDVARLAGVAPGTASRALNQTGYVKQETLEKVRESAKVLNYVPNRAGRSLKTTKTGLVCLAIPDTNNPIYFRMTEAVISTASQHGYSMLLYHTNGTESGEMNALRLLRNNTVDGLFLVHFSYSEALRREIESLAGPVVLCGMCRSLWADAKDNPFDTVSIDIYAGIYQAVVHLVNSGHREIVYLAGKAGIPVYQQRFQAYKQALKDHGLPYRVENVFWHSYDDETGRIAARHFLTRDRQPAALCASNDLQAIGYIEEMQKHNVDPRQSTQIVGVDNTQILQLLGISSVDIQEEKIGSEAARLLFAQLTSDQSKQHENLLLQPSLVVRP